MKEDLKRESFLLKASKRIWMIVGIIFVIMVVLELGMQFYSNLRFSSKNADSLINQIIRIIEKNENSDKILQEALKDEYIIRAKSVSYVLENNPQVENNIDELKKIAALMEVDEIHIFNKNGVIINGSVPKYFGFSMDSGVQMSFFKTMLNNYELSLCQDLTPNTAEGKEMIYAMVWKEDFSELVQVGIAPVRLLSELKSHGIPEVVDSFPLVDGELIFIADAQTDVIIASTLKKVVGKTLSEIGFGNDSDFCFSKRIRKIHDQFVIPSEKTYHNYKIITAFDVESSNKGLIRNSLIIIAYLLLAVFVLGIILKKLHSLNMEKQRDYGVLVSMAQMFFTVYLIDLEKNKVSEYRSNDQIRDLIKSVDGAINQMRLTMSSTITEEYLERILTFTDLTTLSKRMKNKNYISCDVVGTYFGWTRVSFFVLQKNSEGFPTKVVYTTQDIDEQKKEEERLLLTSKTDSLTKLFNRRAFENDIEKYNTQDFEDDFMLLSMDLNGLKTVNDTFGHAAGDDLIIAASNAMRKVLKPYGKIYRMGGDEFTALLQIPKDEIESVMNLFYETTQMWKSNASYGLSISCGYVASPEAKGKKYREIEKLADSRMYEAKRDYYSKMGFDRRK